LRAWDLWIGIDRVAEVDVEVVALVRHRLERLHVSPVRILVAGLGDGRLVARVGEANRRLLRRPRRGSEEAAPAASSGMVRRHAEAVPVDPTGLESADLDLDRVCVPRARPGLATRDGPEVPVPRPDVEPHGTRA